MARDPVTDAARRRAVRRTAPVRVVPPRAPAVVPARPALAREGPNVFGAPARPAAAGLLGAPVRPANPFAVAPAVPRPGPAVPGVVGGGRAALLGENLPGLAGYGVPRVPVYGGGVRPGLMALEPEEMDMIRRRPRGRLPAVAARLPLRPRRSPFAVPAAGVAPPVGGGVPAYEPVSTPLLPERYGETFWRL